MRTSLSSRFVSAGVGFVLALCVQGVLANGIVFSSDLRSLKAVVGTRSPDWQATAVPEAPMAPFDAVLAGTASAEGEMGGTSSASVSASQRSVIGPSLIEGETDLHLFAVSNPGDPNEYLPAFATAEAVFDVRFELTQPHAAEFSLVFYLGAPRLGRIQAGFAFAGPGLPDDWLTGGFDGYESRSESRNYTGLLEPGSYRLAVELRGYSTDFDGWEEPGTFGEVDFRLALQPVPDLGSTGWMLGVGMTVLWLIMGVASLGRRLGDVASSRQLLASQTSRRLAPCPARARGFTKDLLAWVGAGALAVCGTSQAADVKVDFECLPAMGFMSGHPVPVQARLGQQLLPTHGLVFSSESGLPYVGVVDLGIGHATSGRNGFGGVDLAGNLSYATPVWVHFLSPSGPEVRRTTDWVSVRGDLWPTSSRGVTLEAFDLDGNLLATDAATDDHAVVLQVAAAGIHAVRIREWDSVAWDDLEFNATWLIGEPPCPPVGIPDGGSTLTLWVVLLGVMGCYRGGRRLRTGV